jgi:subtilisin family serine protease
MASDQRNRGVPFPDDFSGWHSDIPGGTPEDVQWAVQQLTQLRYEPSVRHELLRLVKERREDAGEDVVQFDWLPAEVGFDTLLVKGELLITTESYFGYPGGLQWNDRAQSARPYLDALGLQPGRVECAELADKIVRLVPSKHLDAHVLADIARNLRLRGFAASFNYCTPTAPVHKHPPLIAPDQTPPPPPGQPPQPAPAQPQPAVRRAEERPAKVARVAIIDTGIANQAVDRADGQLGGVPRTPDNIDPLYSFPIGGPHQFLDFSAGHGTFVAGIVNQVAPYAPIRMYRAIDGDGLASEVDVACAMIEAVKDGNQIINLSLGCQTQDDFPPVALNAALAVIAELDAEKPDEEKTIIVAAAGNCGDRRLFWPAGFSGAGFSGAGFPGVVSVAGLNPNMTPSPWSTRGSWVTCSTVGQGIRSTYVYGKESPLIDPAETEFVPPDPFAVWSGTSFAAPQIAGAIARLYQAPGVSLHGALHELLQVAVPIPDFGRAVQILRGI